MSVYDQQTGCCKQKRTSLINVCDSLCGFLGLSAFPSSSESSDSSSTSAYSTTTILEPEHIQMDSSDEPSWVPKGVKEANLCKTVCAECPNSSGISRLSILSRSAK
jgi:hypothetical protein